MNGARPPKPAHEFQSNLMGYDRTKKLKNATQGGKFLLIKRLDSGKTMENVNIFFLKKGIETACGAVEQMQLLKDKSFLVKTKTLKQAQQLIQVIKFDSALNVDIIEHERLNSSKGVINCSFLKNATDDEIMDELKDYNVVEIYRVKRRENGLERETGTYFFTFASVILPTEINICYMKVQVRPFIPTPMRCFSCLNFNHTAKHCKSPRKLCMTCAEPEHIEEGATCTRPINCINCSSKEHISISKKCPAYVKQSEIQRIKVIEHKSIAEAVKTYNIRNPTLPNGSYSDQLKKTKTCGCACNCNKILSKNDDANKNLLPNGKLIIASSSKITDTIPINIQQKKSDYSISDCSDSELNKLNETCIEDLDANNTAIKRTISNQSLSSSEGIDSSHSGGINSRKKNKRNKKK